MSDLGVVFTTGLLFAFCLGLVRVLIGPTKGDRLLSLLLTGTTSVALLLILYAGSGNPGILDTAMAVAVLAPVTTVAFLLTAKSAGKPSTQDDSRV